VRKDSGDKELERSITVVNRANGLKLTGDKAPTLRNLSSWLEKNAGWDVHESFANLVHEKGSLPDKLLDRVRTSEKKASKSSSSATSSAAAAAAAQQNALTQQMAAMAGLDPFTAALLAQQMGTQGLDTMTQLQLQMLMSQSNPFGASPLMGLGSLGAGDTKLPTPDRKQSNASKNTSKQSTPKPTRPANTKAESAKAKQQQQQNAAAMAAMQQQNELAAALANNPFMAAAFGGSGMEGLDASLLAHMAALNPAMFGLSNASNVAANAAMAQLMGLQQATGLDPSMLLAAGLTPEALASLTGSGSLTGGS
jgi:hypothetical protein